MAARKFYLGSVAILVLVAAVFTTLVATSSGRQTTTDHGMVLIQGGSFQMGREGSYPDESPVHRVRLASFWLDRHEVTNREFAAFVEVTGYVTRAERDGSCWCYLDGSEEFALVPGADWRHPQGPESSLVDRLDHPVVCVSWEDARAYVTWSGKRLPREAEWEYAARAGATSHFAAQVASANEHADLVITSANVWEGTWPQVNHLEDGHYYTAAVGSFESNAWDVHDMIGNVWEWTADWYAADYYASSPEFNPDGADSGEYRVARGGSWFCSPNYCGAYSTHFRGASPPHHAFNNVGFRCARDASDAWQADKVN